MKLFCLYFFLSLNAHSYEVAQLKYSPECILKSLLNYRKIEFKKDIVLPKVRFESQTNLRELNSALYPAQWSTTAKYFSNAYAYKNGHNIIFLSDRAEYYKKHQRYIDDSLAHELFHFVQVKYQNIDISSDEFAEFDAIFVQNWFRQTYFENPSGTVLNPCPN